MIIPTMNALFLDRFNMDVRALRLVIRRINQGELLAIAPEGTRSETGALIEAHQGTAYLAAKTGATVIPVALTGTEDRLVIENLRRLRRSRVTVRAGEPFTLPPLKGSQREQQLKEYTDEIMCRIAALLPERYRGVYADHPRLQEILQEQHSV